MPNLIAYNPSTPISNAIQFGTIVMDVNGDVVKGSLNWCPDFGICNQYIIVTDSYTNGKSNQLNARPMGFKTSGLTNIALIEGINKLAASKFAGPFGTLSDAINWAIYEGYFITNQEYPTIVTDGCVLNLDSNFPPSYPLVFNTWYDLTGNGNTGLLNNGISYNSALRGSLLFNGTNQYVSFSATTNIPVGNSDYTISTWFNPASLGTKGLVGWGNYGTTNAINVLKLTPIGIGNYWGNNDLTTTTYSFTTNNWYNVVATFDGTTRSIWVNGTLVTSDTPVGHNVPNSNNLTIGKTDTSEFFNGNIGEVQIFNRALSTSEISQNYNALLPRYNGTYTDPCNGAPQCTPTPTGTPPLTPTPTPTTPCYGFNLTPVFDGTCDSSGSDVTAYKTTSGSIIMGDTLYNTCGGSTLATGSYSDGTYRYVVNIGEVTAKINCIPLTPTPTPTVTPTATPFEIISGSTICGVQYNGSAGGRGMFYITVELGTDTGIINFNYNAYSIPDQFQVYWDGNLVIDTGFRGSSSYNADLNALGYPNVSGPGIGSSSFSKTSASPTTALVVVTAPLDTTVWNFTMECVPPTPTPTQTPTTTLPCYGFNLTPVFDGTCDSSGSDVTAFKTTPGSIIVGDILLNACGGSTLATGFYSDGTYRYVVNVGSVTDKINCIPLTPTPTQTNTPTKTPTMTMTPTPTNVKFAQCDVLFNSAISDPLGDYSEVYYLNTQTNVPQLLFVGPVSSDIAMTENKLWLYNLDSIYEYNIGLSGGFSETYSRTITCTNVGSNLGMAAKNDTTLIVGGSSIVELDITTSVATTTTLFSLPSGYKVSGDIVYNPLNNNFIISYDNNTTYYIGEFTSGGIIVNNATYNKNTYGILWGMYSYSGGLYGLSNSGRIVSINLTTLALSLITNIGVPVSGAAQTLNCPVIDVTPTPTTTSTQTPTPTATPVYYYYTLHTCWGQPTSISVGRSSSSSYGTSVFLIGGICFQSDGITSGPSYDVDLDSVSLVPGGCSDSSCPT